LVAQAKERPDVLAALRACRLWHGADEAAILRLAATARVESAPRGALLASEGDPADRFGVVITGKVRVYHLNADGRAITFESAGAGEPSRAVATPPMSRPPRP
jgi:CRP-like cAMP-binding protein